MTKQMTPERYSKVIDELGLTQVGAAKFLGLGDRTSRRYVSGDTEVPMVTAMLLELMLKTKHGPEQMRKLVNGNAGGTASHLEMLLKLMAVAKQHPQQVLDLAKR